MSIFLVSILFHQFTAMNNLNLICRAHQLVQEGYRFMFDEKLVTVWSAPNYCYRCGNVAAVLAFTDVRNREAKLFKAVPDENRVIPPTRTTPYFLWLKHCRHKCEIFPHPGIYPLNCWKSMQMQGKMLLSTKKNVRCFEKWSKISCAAYAHVRLKLTFAINNIPSSETHLLVFECFFQKVIDKRKPIKISQRNIIP